MKVACIGYGSFELAVQDICDARGFEYAGRFKHPDDAPADAAVFPLGSTPMMVESSLAIILACCRSPITLVSPLAQVSPRAKLGRGVLIEPFCAVAGKASVHDGAVLQTHTTIAHDCVVDYCANLAPGCMLAGGVRVGARVLLGTGVTVVPNVTIGAGANVWAGAVVQQDVPPMKTYYARQLPQPFRQARGADLPPPGLDVDLPPIAPNGDLVGVRQ